MVTPTAIRVNDAVLLGQYTAGSDEWHAARASGIGGSEIAAVIGLSPWESRYSLYWRKKNRLRPVEETDPMKWGTLIEPVVYQEYEANHLRRGQTMTTGATFAHIDKPWQIANPDGLIWSSNGELEDGVEIKVPGTDHTETWGPDGSDRIPIYYRCQIAWYCSVLGLKSMVLRALIGGNDPRSYRIKPSQADMDYLVREGRAFLDDIENDVLPNLDSHTATYRAVRELHPDIDRTQIIDVDTDFADRWWAAQDALDTAQDEWNLLRSQLADKIGGGWQAKCGDQKIAYRIRPAKPGADPYIKSAPRPKKTETEIAEAAAA